MAVAIMGECVSGPTSWIEWRAEGTFRNPGFLNDDVLVEPSGVRVRSCGVLVLDFSRERVRGIRCYYDGLALVGQVLTRPPVPT